LVVFSSEKFFEGVHLRHNELLVYEPGNQYPKAGDVAPFASLPAWWRRFIFQVLNGRQLAVYLYIVMLVDSANSVAYPLVESIKRDMGLASDTQIYHALEKLERLGFIRRRRMRLPNRSLRLPRNVYQRPAPEFTLLELLKRGRIEDSGRPGDIGIDEFLNPVRCPAPAPADPLATTAIPKDVQAGLKRLLGRDYDAYAYALDGERREMLMQLLEARLDERRREGGEKYATREPAPRDRQRAEASVREKAIAAAGGVVIDARPFSTGFEDEISLEDFEDEIPF
jgi:hypothetical protein